MNILFPIAGRGSRFSSAGLSKPKPLIKVKDKTLLEHAISTLKLEGFYIFVTLKYDDNSFNEEITSIIKKLQPLSKILTIPHPTQGSAETCLAAKQYINNETSLLITNVDQCLDWDPTLFLNHLKKTNPDGCVSLYDHEDVEVGKPSKYAFVELDQDGYAKQFQEKFAISKHSLNGLHYWKYGKDFVSSVTHMIEDNIRVNNEFYFSPSYNYMIKDGKHINTFYMNKDQYFSLGSPEEILKNINKIK